MDTLCDECGREPATTNIGIVGLCEDCHYERLAEIEFRPYRAALREYDLS